MEQNTDSEPENNILSNIELLMDEMNEITMSFPNYTGLDDFIAEVDNENDSDSESEHTVTHTNWRDKISEDELLEIETMTNEMIDEYISTDASRMSSPEFHTNMVSDITTEVVNQLIIMELCIEEDADEIAEYVQVLCDTYFEANLSVPPRSYPNTFADPITEITKRTNAIKIKNLQNLPQPTQRTPEWYAYRHKIITASNIWKVFGSESFRNSLIYEKCKPIEEQTTHVYSSNTLSPLHWGNKYEPVTLAVYEKIYNTKVADFGCITHPTYSFIGASPDGINVDTSSDRFGRMVEIKNIFNREITGIPKEEYWIQMQVQMETCDLNECDFVETRFKEYESSDSFYEDELLHEHRGLILYFLKKTTDLTCVSNAPHYVYMPLNLSLEKEDIEKWIQQKRVELSSEYSLYDTLYWYLDEISCVLVKRNTLWFNQSVDRIKELWDIIERERVDGYEHRCARKKAPKIEIAHDEDSANQTIKNMPQNSHVCLIKLDENGNIQ